MMNVCLKSLEARQRLAIVDAKCSKKVNVFWLLVVTADSMQSDKGAGWPMCPNTYVVIHITRTHRPT